MAMRGSSLEEEGIGGLACDRRALLAGSGCGLLLLAAPAVPLPAAAVVRHDGQLSFFDDRPMVDRSGKLAAYRPPAGFHGARSFPGITEERFRHIVPFMT